MTIRILIRSLAAFILLITLSACQAHLVSTHIGPKTTPTVPLDGLFYTLPQTVVTVSIPVTLTKVEKGRYGEFAELFFGRKNKPSLKFGTPTYSSRGEPDPRQMYFVKANGDGPIQQTLTFTFSEAGAVTGLKADVDNQRSDLVLAGLSTAAGIAGRTFLAGGGEEEEADSSAENGDTSEEKCSDKDPGCAEERIEKFRNCQLPDDQVRKHFDDLDSAIQQQYADYYYKDCGDDDKDCREAKRKFKEAFSKAKGAYEKITELVRVRNGAIDTFNVTPGLDSYYSRAAALIKERMQQFVGTKAEHSWTGVFDVLPEECNEDRSEACDVKVSRKLLSYLDDQGICFVSDVRGRALPGSMKADCTNKKQEQKHLQLRFTLVSEAPLDPNDPEPVDQIMTRIASNFERPEEAGIYFIVPARVQAEVIVVDEPIDVKSPEKHKGEALHGSADVMVAQMGIVAAMPSKLGGKSFTHDLQFYASSGALKSYTLVSKPLATKGVLDSVSASTNALLDARNKQREAEENEAFNALKREADTLALLLAKQKACAELDEPPVECGP